MRIVIVGGVAAGVTAATRLKRLMEDASVVLFERSDRISLANCALPYYSGGVVRRQSLFAASAEGIHAQYGVDVRERQEVLSIDRTAKRVRVKNLMTGDEYDEPYDKLVLATGAQPRMLPIPGLAQYAFPLWRSEDAVRLEEKLSAVPHCRVGIMGGGAVGLEAAENVVRRGGTVDLYEYGRTVMGRNDEGLSNAFVRLAMNKSTDLRIHTQTSITKVEKNASGELVLSLSDGSSTTVDYLISAAGVEPRSKLAQDAGLEMGPRGTVAADGFLTTSDPSIFAVGDVAATPDPKTGERRAMMLAGAAVKEARKAASVIAGLSKTPMAGGFGTNAVSLMGTLWASTGKSEQALINSGLVPNRDFLRATAVCRNHVSWYPGSVELILKVLFDPAGKILGAQAMGREGADKRIDVISTAMRFGATVRDLSELDLIYCPQTGCPKDPVNAVGHIAENILDDLVRFIEPNELRALLKGEAPELGVPAEDLRSIEILDVREAEEIAADPFPGDVLHVPVGELRERLDEIPTDKAVVVVCRAAVRAYAAARVLMQRSVSGPVFVLTGGMRYWHITAPLTASSQD